MPQDSHFWTTDPQAEGLSEPAWAFEGVVFHILTGLPDQLPAGVVPLFRFCDSARDRHLWTLDPDGEALPKSVFQRELVVGYVFPTRQPGTVPLYRWYSPRVGRHFWTTDVDGEQVLDPPAKLECTVCHVYPNSALPATHLAPVFRWRRAPVLQKWQLDIHRAIAESSGLTKNESVASQSILAVGWTGALAKANQLFDQHQPADGYHLIDERSEQPV